MPMCARGSEATCLQKSPLRRSALSGCPCGDPWGRPLQEEMGYSWAPVKPPKGTNTKVTSAKGHFCAYPTCSTEELSKKKLL